ncbi:unnamed protein product [Urochloa humidicola]
MQFPVLLEKLDALDPPKKRTRRSAKKKSDDRPTLTPEIRARYKEMGVILKELGDTTSTGRRWPEAAARARCRERRQSATATCSGRQAVNDRSATVPCSSR